MSDLAASIHLKRAYGLIKEVEQKTEELRSHVIQHEQNAREDQPFVAGMVNGFQESRRLSAEKTSLKADLDLALAELEKADGVDQSGCLETEEGTFQAIHLRAAALMQLGIIEGLYGVSNLARQYLARSIEAVDSAAASYWMALLYEGDHDPVNALQYYEHCLALDPAGDYSIAALRSANDMRNYKKRFRGDWGLLGCLFIFFFPAAIYYYFIKRK